ncbi:hypothetical protein QFC21_005862 [Naganishia friedmannii]|uniref:Uncharacterized protein n=1 Tax=Naganishia friedmannii TaxID=89922 RepID=A0ACC2V5U0_9TREE|nr:hypothetical protein QFC21_005862 [Naganishia friedmannii]
MQSANLAGYPHGPAATKLVPFDPTKPYTRSSLPPAFLLAILCIVIGIPSYLIYQGAFKTTEDSLENKIRKQDESYTAAAAGDKKKNQEKDLDDPAAPLDLQDLKGLGGLVGLAAIVVMAFALFPEELNTALGGLTENASIQGVTRGYFDSAPAGAPDLPAQHGFQGHDDPAHETRSYGTEGYPDSEPSRSRSREREYLADEGILPLWAEGLPEDQWWETKSHKEIMLVCRIKPWLCDEDGLPIVKPVSRRVPKQRPQVTQPVLHESASLVVEASVNTKGRSSFLPFLDGDTETRVVDGLTDSRTFLEQHMAVLRSQSILLLPYDEESFIDFTRVIIALFALSPLALFYAYYEMLKNAGITEDNARKEDKKLSLDEKAAAEILSNKNKKEVSEAKLKKIREEKKALEAIDDQEHQWREEFRERPWWAGSSWQLDPELQKKSERPWRKERQAVSKWGDAGEHNFEPNSNGKKRKPFISARHLRLDFDEELEEAKVKRHEAEVKKILAKYPEDQKAKEDQPYRGLLSAFKIDERGTEKLKKPEEELRDRTNLDNAVEIQKGKVRSMTKTRDRGQEKSRRKEAIDSLSKEWDKLADMEKKEKEEARWPVNRYMKDLGLTKGYTKIERLTDEEKQWKGYEAKWAEEEAKEEEEAEKYIGTLEDRKKRFGRQAQLMHVKKLRHWQKRILEKPTKTDADKAYLEVLHGEFKARKEPIVPKEEPRKVQATLKERQAEEAAAADKQVPDAPPKKEKPKGFLAKASALLDKVGQA